MRGFLLFVLLCISQGLMWSEIKECCTLLEIEQYIDEKTLVVFDLDNTLIRPKQMLGSDEWFCFYFNKKIDEYGDRDRAEKAALSLWLAIHTVSSMQCIEPCTQSVIKKLQQKGIPLMVLTVRNSNAVNVSIRQLHSVHLDFSKTAPVEHPVNLHGIDCVRYEKGVLFVADHNKGEALLQFLQQHSLQPEKIVFIDDKWSLVEQVKVVESAGIEYVGLRYGGADRHRQNFDPEVAEEQLRFLMNILSDEEARKKASLAA